MIHRDALWILELRKAKVSKMTMKKQKTLHRFAAVVAVLLAFCLVFMMPVGAEEEESSVTEVSTWDGLKSALEAGGSIKLISDVEPTETLTKTDYLSVKENTVLDLNGKTIYAEYATAESFQLIKISKEKSFTINDNSDEKKGLIFLNYTDGETDAWDDTLSVINAEGFATLIINSGTLKIESVTGFNSGFYAVDFSTRSGTSTFTMNGGKLISEYIGLRVPLADNTAKSVVTINNGEIESRNQCIWIHQTSQTGTRSYELTINNGVFTSTNSAAIAYWLMCNDNAGTYVTTINNGHFTGTPTSSYPGIIGYYNAYISGQDPDTKKWIYQSIDVDKHSLNIYGGTFTMTNADIIGILHMDVKGPTVTLSATITGDNKVSSSNNFVGTYTASQIGTSYEWFIDDANVVTTSENTYTHTFEPVGSAIPKEKKVSVRVILSDKYSITTEPITVTVPAKYDVTYSAGEGSGTMDAGFAYSDDNVIVLPDCTFTAPEGKTFKAWQIGETEYAAGVSYTVTADTSVTAVWKEVGAEVKPEIDVTIEVAQDGKTTTISSVSTDETTKVETTGTVTTITDLSTGVKMDIQFESVPATNENSGEITGSIQKVSVSYPEEVAESTGTEEVKQQVLYEMSVPTDEFLEIDSKVKDEVKEKVTKKEQRANVLSMITATHENLAAINNHITSVTVVFKVHASMVSNPNLLKGYHVDDDTDVVSPVTTSVDKIGDYYEIRLTSNLGFSSYVLVEEEPKQSSGSAVDTGSGNYQYYPRSVPTDGIVDFGTSKVVTGMELPAGSDGTVTLNIKPDFAMPENGFYAFEIDAPGYNLDAKINGGLSFQIPVADLEAAGWTAEDIVLFHGTVGEDGKITWEALPTNLVKNENGVAYYKAAINGCSPFYIGFVKDGSVVNTEVVDPVTPETPVTPDTPEVLPPVDEPETPEQPTESPAPILAVLAGLGAAVVLRRK